ncbi:MAG: hypothetical protein WBW16_13325 [Bacteroidota bacterium]
MSLIVGDVFRAINAPLSGASPHFHIVVQKTQEELVVVTYTTTNIKDARKHCQRVEKIKLAHIEPETLVVTGPNDCDSFSEPCAINCNHVQMREESYYEWSPSFKRLSPVKNQDLVVRIREAIKKSPVVEQRIIKLL